MDARVQTVWLYRRRLSLTSGAGQLVSMQARALEEAGAKPSLLAERGRLDYLLRTGRRVKRVSPAAARALALSGEGIFVDHSTSVPEARVVFVHNVSSAAARLVPGADLAEALRAEQAFFGALDARARLVANSAIVRDALASDYSIEPGRIAVLHPGFDAARFGPIVRAERRARARAALGIDAEAPLIGFVTSGNLAKRGIDAFLAAALRIRAERADARFLVVGSARLPEQARRHVLAREACLLHRPKSPRPERWFAALDVFLYPAHWEEYGMVVAEALALGLPVLTSRRVGAAAILPEAYRDWLGETPEPTALAERALELIEDAELRARLGDAGMRAVAPLHAQRYGAESARLILEGVPGEEVAGEEVPGTASKAAPPRIRASGKP